MSSSRYWCGILYPENMIEDWEKKIDNIVQIPYAYCIHDKDLDNDDDERKIHVHLIFVYGNTTTYKNMLGLYNKLSKPGLICCSTCEQIYSIRQKYNYLIHDTDKARSEGKYQYSKDERITGNGFDIGSYEQVSIAEKNAVLKHICQIIQEMYFVNYMSLFEYIMLEYSDNDIYFEMLKVYSGFLERLCKGNFQRMTSGHKSHSILRQECDVTCDV